MPRARFTKSVPSHVTVRLRPKLPSLRDTRIVREIERSFAAGCERPGFRLVHYSLQGNHAHLIVEAHDRAALGRGMMAVGARLARAVNRVAKRTDPCSPTGIINDSCRRRARCTARSVTCS